MVKLFDLVKVNTSTTGTGTITFGPAFSDAFFTPTEAGASDGDSVSYVLVEGDDVEIGTGVIGASVTTITRTVLKSKIGGAAGTTKMTLGGTAWLAFTALDRDILVPANNLNDVANADDARSNIGAFGLIRVQKFTASGTYTPDDNLLYAVIEGVGGGAGGGGASGSAGTSYSGAGGGSGGYSRSIYDAATIGASQAVTIGAAGTGGSGSNNGNNGGDTSVGTLMVAKGGVGGRYGSSAQFGTPIASAVAGTGNVIATPGVPGFGGWANSALSPYLNPGSGASSVFGGGAPGINSLVGANATGYGSGGSGGQSYNGASGAAGGNGMAGLVIITEYCSQ